MALITAQDIYSRIYQENVDEITRSGDNITQRALDGAQEEAKMYLTRFDLDALFGLGQQLPAFNAPFLKQLCVDLAVWQLVRLGNPNINYDTAKYDYEAALRKLRDIQSGKAMPAGWPYAPDVNPNLPDGDSIIWIARPRRHNYYN